MTHTKVELVVFLPTTSSSRVSDAVGEMIRAAEKHKGSNFFVTYSGPHSAPGSTGVVKHEERPGLGGSAEPSGDERSDEPRDEPVKRRGRPRKAEGARPPAEGPERPDSDGAEERGGDEPVGTGPGTGQGADEGEGGSRGAGRGRDDQRRTGEAPRLKTPKGDDDDWGTASEDDWGASESDEARSEEDYAKEPGDDWPDHLTPETIDKATITALLGDHFKATGNKDKTLTLDVMKAATGHRAISEVDKKDFRTLAKFLLKDIARYTHGIKKPR